MRGSSRRKLFPIRFCWCNGRAVQDWDQWYLVVRPDIIAVLSNANE